MRGSLLLYGALLSCLLLCTLGFVEHLSLGCRLAAMGKLSRPRGLLAVTMAAESSSMKDRLAGDMKEAMKSKEKVRLAAIRSIQVAIKQKEVDDRTEVTDEAAVGIMAKLVKQRKESIKSYQDGGRPDLAENERLECEVISSYMPQQMSLADLDKVVADAISSCGATTVKDMGKVMAILKPILAGKADMSEVGSRIRDKLGNKG